MAEGGITRWQTLEPASLAAGLFTGEDRILLAGPPGAGKTTLAAELADLLAADGQSVACLGADPGSPAFGVPGALNLAVREQGGWRALALEGLCTLDAGRFRLPLVEALRRLLALAPPGPLLVDGPGVTRGIAAAELLPAIVEAAAVDAVVMLNRGGETPALLADLGATGARLHVVRANPLAARPGKRVRARRRTALWNHYLEHAEAQRIGLDGTLLLGTPPPPGLAAPWAGRQVALLDRSGWTISMGEVTAREGGELLLRALPPNRPCAALLVRDAQRGAGGLLETASRPAPELTWSIPPPDLFGCPRHGRGAAEGPRPVLRAGAVTAALVNGVFGDPLLHLRLRYRRRSLLFDLGEAGQLTARTAHQVSDLFLSHAHFDHIAGFPWLLRSRIGVMETCRVFGPPGLARNLQGMIDGILWDRIGDRGPRFEVAELHGDRLLRWRLKAGTGEPEPLAERAALGGLLFAEDEFRVRAATLDHHTPVLAYAFEPARTLNVRKDRLLESGFAPGPWLGELKARIARDEPRAMVELPDGSRERAGRLAGRLLLVEPGRKVVYATDLADSAENRRRLTDLARGAHTLFCEAAFLQEDVDQARRTAHLTARACGEIATAAGVERLVPFHFSRRYEKRPGRVYDEVRAACPRVVSPPALGRPVE